MSILIHGFEMPTSEQGARTINIYADGVVTNYAEVTIGKASPVPEHGRLVDADSLMAYFEKIADIEWNKKAAPISWSYAFEDVMDDIEHAPTIIPADKEGE